MALDASTVARATGGDVVGRDHVLSPGPGHSPRDRSLSIKLDPAAPDGFILHPHAGDDWRTCRDYVRARLGLAEWRPGECGPPTRAVAPSRPRCGEADADAARRREVAQNLWMRAHPGQGTLAEAYLLSRGIVLDVWPGTVRFLPASPPNHLWPTMIAAFGIPTEPEPGVLHIKAADVVGVHLTYLKLDGSGKAPIEPAKRMIGRGHTAPIVLAPMNDSLGLIIAEGIEDAATIHAETGLGAWAAGSANRLPGLAELVPAYTDHITIVADDDDAGRQGAENLRANLRVRNISASVLTLKGCRDGAGHGRECTAS